MLILTYMYCNIYYLLCFPKNTVILEDVTLFAKLLLIPVHNTPLDFDKFYFFEHSHKIQFLKPKERRK